MMKLLSLILTVFIQFKLSQLQELDKDEKIGIESLIPLNFPDQNIENYTVRYLNNSSSSDTPDCLVNQQLLSAENVSSCKSLAHAVASTVRGPYNRSVARRVRNLIVLISPGTYGLERGITAEHATGLILAKQQDKSGEVVFRCGDTETTIYNLDLKYSQYVSINGIVWTGCGPRGAAVRLTQTRSVTITGSIFKHNLQCGLILSHCSDVLIEKTHFTNNTAASEYITNLALESVSFRVAGGLTVAYRNSSVPSNVTVKSCSFKGNRATVHQANSRDSTLRPSSYVPRGHGGGILAFFRNSSNHRLHVTDSIFSDNIAEFAGGAVAVLFYRSPEGIGSTNNSVILEKSTFVNNHSPSGLGGAIGGTSFEAAYSNTIVMRDTKIINNSASAGGGGFSFIEDNVGSDITDFISNRIVIESAVFEGNTSPKVGGAVNLVYFSRMDQSTSKALISNSIFSNNQALHGGGIHSQHYAIKFRGQNIFLRNSNSAWYITSALVICQDHILFHSNQAQYGGAITLKMRAIMELEGHVNITFLGNSATVHGGGIFVSHSPLTADLTDYQLIYQRCFVRHDRVSGRVSFIENVAGQDGAAIFATEVNTCSYTLNAEEQVRAGRIIAIKFNEDPYCFRNNTIVDSHPRIFTNKDIATEPFVLETPYKIITGAPGQTLHLSIRCVDQLGNYRPCFWTSNFVPGLFALPEDGDHIQYQVRNLNHYNITKEEFAQNCSNYFSRKLRFTVIQGLTNDVINVTEIVLNITCCNAGYSLVKNRCVLNRNNTAILRADSSNKYFYKTPLHYVGVRDEGIMSAQMPLSYQKCTQLGSISGCLFQHDQPDNQCQSNRSGFLCGVCGSGTSVDTTLSLCVTCLWWHTLFHILFVITWILFCIMVLVYNIGISTTFKGFFFYIQIIGYVYDNTPNGIVWDNHLSKTGYFAYIPFCIFPGLSALAVVSRGFFIALLTILTIVVYVISARFLKRLSNRNSFDGIWFISFIIYKLAADSCYGILLCQKVYGSDPQEYVYHFDGSFKCFSKDDPHYLAFGVVAIAIGILVLIFPLFILFISFKRYLLTQNITDILNKDIRPSCRWWSSFDLYRRLLFTVSVLFLHYVNPSYTQLSLFFSSLFVFVVFAFANPYTSRKAYYIEAALLLDLIIVSAIFVNTDSNMQQRLVWLTSSLLLFPYLMVLLYFAVKLITFLWIKYCPDSWQHAVQDAIKTFPSKICSFMTTVKVQRNYPQKQSQFYSTVPENYLVNDAQNIPSVESRRRARESGNSKIFSSAPTFQSFLEYREELLDSSEL